MQSANALVRFRSSRATRILFATAAFAIITASALAQSVPVVTGDARVDKLLSQMTLQEKLILIHGTQEDPNVYQGQAGYLAGIPRLGIPGLRFADGPPGVLTRHPSQGETATMGVAATFSLKDAEDNGIVIGREDRALGIDVSLQPFVNIDRDLEFGRGYNTFGEDPFLTSQIGAAEIKGIQSQHVMAQVKHYVGYDSDNENTFIDDQTLHEVYVAPFDAAVKADVSSIMCSYNRLNGTFACGNKDTLTTILRDQIGFKGFVTSDWGATHAVNFINAGLDMEMPGEPDPKSHGFSISSFFDSRPIPPPPTRAAVEANANMFGGHIPEEPAPKPEGGGGNWGVKLSPEKMPEALKDGTVTEAAVTRAAGRVLYEIVHFGYLDGESKHSITTQSIEQNARIIEKTGEDAAVLLKNEGNLLPLKHEELDSIVLIGPTAAQVDSIGINGERSVGIPERQIGPLTAMKSISGNSNIGFAVDDDMTGSTVPAGALSHGGQPGLERAIVNTPSSQTAIAATQVDPQIDFTIKGGNALPPNSLITWKGTLTPPHPGVYWLYLQALGTNATIKLDGKRLAATGAFQGGIHGDILQANQDNAIPTTDGLDNVRRAVDLTAGPHSIEISTSPDTSDSPVQVRLNWYTPEQRQADHEHAIAAAKTRQDRRRLCLDSPRTRIRAARRSGQAHRRSSRRQSQHRRRAQHQPARRAPLGRQGERRSRNVVARRRRRLVNRQHPSRQNQSRRPSPRHLGQEPHRLSSQRSQTPRALQERRRPVRPPTAKASTSATAGSTRKTSSPSSPSATASATPPSITPASTSPKPPMVASTSASTSKTPAPWHPTKSRRSTSAHPAEIPDGVQFPVRALVAFERIHLAPGESKAVTLHVAQRQLQYWSTKDQKWTTESGKRPISVGGSSRDLRLHQTIN